MNMAYKNMYALVLFAAVATTVPMHAMENDGVAVEQDIATEVLTVPAVWYKKRSMQIAAVAMTTAVALYAVAVQTDKVSSPAVLAGMFFAQFAHKVATEPEQDNNTSDDQDNVAGDEVSDNGDATEGNQENAVQSNDQQVENNIEKLTEAILEDGKESIQEALVEAIQGNQLEDELNLLVSLWDKLQEVAKKGKTAVVSITDEDLRQMNEDAAR